MSILDTCGARWMWPSVAGDGPNQYVQFRQEFSLDSVGADAHLHISVDSDYTVWINGAFAGCGQWHDFPDAKTYDTLDVASLLKAGRNVMCVLVWYRGMDSFQYIPGAPGLIYALENGAGSVVSGESVSYRLKTGYRYGPIHKITPQLFPAFEFDAQANDDWLSDSYTLTSDWSAIASADLTAADSRGEISARPIAKLNILDRVSSRIIAHGLFNREGDDSQGVAELMQSDYLSARPYPLLFADRNGCNLPSDGLIVNAPSIAGSTGFYVVVDLGREDVGFFDLEIEADAGTIIDVAWGEHLDDLRVRSSVGGRSFAFRYTCAEGRQCFTNHFLRLGVRYIQLHVSGVSKQFVLHYAGILPTPYPIVERGSFVSPDNQKKLIYDTAVRTLHLCMHEHYEDCPWREQALYGNDSRNQALCGYYCFGEYAFPAAAFDLLGRSLKDDGFLELCAPARISITIPGFTMAWILAVADHLMYSGDLDFASRQMPRIANILEHCATHLKTDGLLISPRGKRFWHFYDWAQGLDGTDSTGAFHVLERQRLDAPLNLLYCLALDAANLLAKTLGSLEVARTYQIQADAIRYSFHEAFWAADVHAYRTFIGEDAPNEFNELTQALALLAGVCPDDKAAGLRAKLAQADNGLVETTLSQSLYKFEALLGEPEIYARYVFDKIAADWGYMLSRGATSFWETIKGGDDFGNAGSLCHGWSGIPVYFYHAYLLGIKPTKPGFAEFEFKPLMGIVQQASGRVPTPHGCIDICWEERDGQLSHQLSGPKNCSVL